jgi:hypothetical protein
VTARVGTVRSGTSRISQVVTLIAVVVPPLGIACADFLHGWDDALRRPAPALRP